MFKIHDLIGNVRTSGGFSRCFRSPHVISSYLLALSSTFRPLFVNLVGAEGYTTCNPTHNLQRGHSWIRDR
jgi:hypothetical protein